MKQLFRIMTADISKERNVSVTATTGFSRKAVVTVAASHTLHDVYSSFFAPLIPLLSEKLGFTYAAAGVLSVVPKAPSLLNPLLGYVADKLLVRWFLIISPLVTIITMSLIGMAPSVTVLAIILLITGLSAAIYVSGNSYLLLTDPQA